MNSRFDLLFRFMEMTKALEEEQRKSAISRIQSEALKIVLDKRHRRINQLGALSSKICETIKREREEKRELQLQYCPETLDAEDSDERAKLFVEDKEEGGVKLYIQNTDYKKIVLNVKDLTDICEVTTDSEAENELTTLGSVDTIKKKKNSKKSSKIQKKQEMPVPRTTPQPSTRKKKKKKHNDSLSDEDPLVVAPAPMLQRITLTETDIDTLTEDFDAEHTLKLKHALEGLMEEQGFLFEDTTTREGVNEAGNKSVVTDVADDSIDDGSGGVTVTDLSEVCRRPPSGFSFFSDDSIEASNASSANSNPSTTVRLETEVEHRSKKKKNLDTSFDVNDVD